MVNPTFLVDATRHPFRNVPNQFQQQHHTTHRRRGRRRHHRTNTKLTVQPVNVNPAKRARSQYFDVCERKYDELVLRKATAPAAAAGIRSYRLVVYLNPELRNSSSSSSWSRVVDYGSRRRRSSSKSKDFVQEGKFFVIVVEGLIGEEFVSA